MRRRETRNVQPLSTRAAVQPSSLNEEARTVDVVWSTGERVQRGFFDRFWEELSMDPAHVRLDRLAGGAPVLDSHNSGATASVIGVVDSVALEGERGVATLRFAQGDPLSDGIWSKIQQGVLRNVSVGYRVHRLERQEEDADDGLPVFRATNWEPLEISVVPIGADSGASVRSDGALTNQCEFVTHERIQPMEKENSSAPVETPTAETRTEQTLPAPATLVPDLDATRAAARAAERERIAVITRTAAGLGLPDEFVQQHVEGDTTVDEFRAAAFDEFERRKAPVIPVGNGPSITPGDDQRDKFIRGASNWLIARSGSGVGNMVARAEKQSGGSGDIDAGEFRGMSYADLARHALERNGVNTRGMDKMALFGAALTMRSPGMAATGDFPVLLETSVERVLLAQYAITSDKWSQFCATGSVPDFRDVKRLRMGTFGKLDLVNEHGEFRAKSIPDARAETISADTYGNTISLTRQVLINDDIGFTSRLAAMLGRAARLSIEVDVFDLLKENSGLGPNMADGNPLFDASHGNLGAGAALSIAALDANYTILAEQTDESGNETLEISPYALVVPRGLQSLALNINGSEFDIDSGAPHSRVPNVVQGFITNVVGSTRLSGTRRYIFANPAEVPTIEVVFLDGNDQPFLEARNGWTIDGVEWKVRLDYGVGAIDYRGAVTDAGA